MHSRTSARGLIAGLASCLMWAVVALGAMPVSTSTATGHTFTATLTTGAVVPEPGPEAAGGTARFWSYSDRDGAARGQLELTSASASGQCEIAVEPSTVAVGQEFVVSGDFAGYAAVYMARGSDNLWPDPDSEPAATVPEGTSSVRVTFTARAADIGVWTIWVEHPQTGGCMGSAVLTIVAPPADAAMPPSHGWLSGMGVLLLVLACAFSMRLATRKGTGMSWLRPRPRQEH